MNNKLYFKRKTLKDFISVIIPVYKDASGLKDTLSSLNKQSINKKKYEIIVANDGADTIISDICKQYKVKEVVIPQNKGSYNARNKALEESVGEFIAFTDANVIVPSNWLEVGIKLLQEIDYVGGPVKFTKKEKYNTVELYNNIFEFDTFRLMSLYNYCVTANLFTKRLVFNSVGGFDSRLISGGDNEFGNRVHFFSKFIQKYSDLIPVVHPFRNYKETITKNKRIYIGMHDLLVYYPTRYGNYAIYLVNEIAYVLIPPIKYCGNIKLFFFIWWMKFINLYIKIISYKFVKLINTQNILKRITGVNYRFAFKM